MKKYFISICLSLLLILPVFSYEWGGVIGENAKVSSTDVKEIYAYSLRQSNNVSLWANFPFNKQGTFYFATQASYKYNYDVSLLDSNLMHIADLDLLKLNAIIPVGNYSLTVSAGRFQVTDETSRVFAQNCDGVNLKFATPMVVTTLYAGYTGLLNGYNTTMLAKAGSAPIKDNPVYALSSPYVPLLLYVDFPSLFLNQSLGLQISSFLDLGEEEYIRNYATISLKGPLGGPFYYNIASCFGTETFDSFSNYSDLYFQMFFKSVAIKLEAEYASGNQACFSPFRGFTSQTAYNSSASPEYSGLLMPSLDLVFFKNSIYIDFNNKLVMGMPESDITINGVNSALTAVINIFSDTQFNTTLSGFYDILNNGEENNFTFSLGLLLSF